MSTPHNFLVLALSFALAAAGVTRASASVLFDSNGFEAPDFSTTYDAGGAGYAGQLKDQPLPSSTFFTESISTTTSTATVIANPGLGTNVSPQVVELHRVPNATGSVNDTRWGVATPITPISVTVSWDMYVLPTTVPPGDGPFFGVETYGLPGGGFSVLGTLGVDASTGLVLIQAPVTGDFVPVSGVALGAWNSFTLFLDYVTQTFTASVNALPVAVGVPFVDGLSATFNDADLSGLQSSATGAASEGIAYYDNFKVEAEGVVPEPASFLVWGLGALIATGIYRTRSSRKSE